MHHSKQYMRLMMPVCSQRFIIIGRFVCRFRGWQKIALNCVINRSYSAFSFQSIENGEKKSTCGRIIQHFLCQSSVNSSVLVKASIGNGIFNGNEARHIAHHWRERQLQQPPRQSAYRAIIDEKSISKNAEGKIANRYFGCFSGSWSAHVRRETLFPILLFFCIS